MSWETPEGFLWLLAAPIVFLLYLLRGRSQPQDTATGFLWRRALARRSAWRRARPWVSAGWRALVIVFLVAALAAPMLGPRNVQPRLFAIVLDATASMKATDVEGGRFAAAKKTALTVIRQLGVADRCAVVVVGAEPRIVLRATGDAELLQQMLEETPATDAEGDVAAGVRIADSMFRGASNARILVFTDAPIDRSIVKNAELSIHAQALAAENAAVTAIAARPIEAVSDERKEGGDVDPQQGEQYQVVAQLFSSEANDTLDLVWSLDGDEVSRGSVSLREGRGVSVETFPTAGVVSVQLTGKDHLAADDRAVVKVDAARLQEGIATSTRKHFVSPESGVLTGPDGSPRKVESSDSSEKLIQLIGPFDEVGSWRWTSATGVQQECEVSLLSNSESNLSSGVEISETAIAAGRVPATRQQGWFFLLALLTWTAEWLAFIVGVTE